MAWVLRFEPRTLIAGIVATAVAVCGCNASFPTEPSTPAPIAELAIRYPPSGTRLVVGAIELINRRFDAYTIDTDGVYTLVTDRATWTSSHTHVIRQSLVAPGTWNVFQGGNAEIYATYQGFVASLPVVVRDPAPFPRLEIVLGSIPLRAELVSGSSITNRVNVTSSVTWRSSDERVATLNANGAVISGLPGNVEIQATFGGLSDSYWMSVPPLRR